MIGLVTLGALCAIFVTLWLRADQRASDLERSLGERNRRIDHELVRVMKAEANLESEKRRVHSVRLALAEILGLDQFDDQTDLLGLTKAAFESNVEAVTKLVKENRSLRGMVKDPKVSGRDSSPCSGIEAMSRAQRAHRANQSRDELAQAKIEPGQLRHCDLVARRPSSVLELRRRVRDGEDLSGITHSHGCCEVEDWPITLNRITSAELRGRV